MALRVDGQVDGSDETFMLHSLAAVENRMVLDRAGQHNGMRGVGFIGGMLVEEAPNRTAEHPVIGL